MDTESKRPDRTCGLLSLEASIALTIFLFLMLFLYGYASAPQPQPVQQQAAQRTQQQNYPTQSAPVQQPVYQTQAASVYQAQAMPQYAQPQTTPMNFGETTVLGGGTTIGETTVLDAGAQKVQIHPHLIRAKNNERIDINKPVFRIGKERSYVDYFIGDNTAVSRSHANIISREGEYFIVDTNSTNHTYPHPAAP